MRLLVAVGDGFDVLRLAALLPEFEHGGIIVDVASTIAFGSGTGCVPELAWRIPQDFARPPSVGSVTAWGEDLFRDVRPDAVVVCGQSPVAVGLALSAARSGLPVIHIDAGLRSGDLSDRDEIDRVIISRIAALHLAPTEQALENLEDEGIEPERIHFTGSVLAEAVLTSTSGSNGGAFAAGRSHSEGGDLVVAVSRNENLADADRLRAIADGVSGCGLDGDVLVSESFSDASGHVGIAFPALERPAADLAEADLVVQVRGAAAVLTDSGDVAEIACVLGVPCVTVLPRTDREATIATGANRLVSATPDMVCGAVTDAMAQRRNWLVPKRWDTAVSSRVLRALRRGVEPLS